MSLMGAGPAQSFSAPSESCLRDVLSSADVRSRCNTQASNASDVRGAIGGGLWTAALPSVLHLSPIMGK